MTAAECPVVQAAKIHKWTDEHGNVHYGRKPPVGTNSNIVATQRSHISDDAAKKQLKSLSGKTRQQDKNREFIKRTEDEDRSRQGRQKENCATAKKNLSVLQNSNRVKVKDATGQPFYLSEDAKQKKIERTKSHIKEFCR